MKEYTRKFQKENERHIVAYDSSGSVIDWEVAYSIETTSEAIEGLCKKYLNLISKIIVHLNTDKP